MLIRACADCADKLRKAHYILTDKDVKSGECPWCKQMFSSISVYECVKNAPRRDAGRYAAGQRRSGGGERNRRYED